MLKQITIGYVPEDFEEDPELEIFAYLLRNKHSKDLSPMISKTSEEGRIVTSFSPKILPVRI